MGYARKKEKKEKKNGIYLAAWVSCRCQPWVCPPWALCCWVAGGAERGWALLWVSWASRDHRAIAVCLPCPHPVPQQCACSPLPSLVLSWVSGWCPVSLGHIWLWVCSPRCLEGSPSCCCLSPPVFPHQRMPPPPPPARLTAPSYRLLPGLCPPQHCVGFHS